jgi:hypothetical protein
MILYVSRAGGHFQAVDDSVLFWIPASAEAMLILAWPDLQRRRDQDLI